MRVAGGESDRKRRERETARRREEREREREREKEREREREREREGARTCRVSRHCCVSTRRSSISPLERESYPEKFRVEKRSSEGAD